MSGNHDIYLCLDALVRRYADPTPADPEISLARYELKVFSQNGEDGIIAEILRRVGIGPRIFVEFGVESGREGNCVFLADVLGWSGLFIEADDADFRRLCDKYEASPRVRTLQAFVGPDNVEELFGLAGLAAEPDLISIDVDGVDYWIWDAIESYRPRLLVIEYNAALGGVRRAVQPPDLLKGFDATDNFGASIAALEGLAELKGYRLVHTDLTGCNAFFVRTDLAEGRFAPLERVVRTGYPNYLMSGIEHRHDPATDRYADPFPELGPPPVPDVDLSGDAG